MKMLVRVKAIREGEKMFKKKVEFVRSHFVLLAHQHRVPIPMGLEPKKVLALAPRMLAELAKVATLPRVNVRCMPNFTLSLPLSLPLSLSLLASLCFSLPDMQLFFL